MGCYFLNVSASVLHSSQVYIFIFSPIYTSMFDLYSLWLNLYTITETAVGPVFLSSYFLASFVDPTALALSSIEFSGACTGFFHAESNSMPTYFLFFPGTL